MSMEEQFKAIANAGLEATEQHGDPAQMMELDPIKIAGLIHENVTLKAERDKLREALKKVLKVAAGFEAYDSEARTNYSFKESLAYHEAETALKGETKP